jgi:hypothetical protein
MFNRGYWIIRILFRLPRLDYSKWHACNVRSWHSHYKVYSTLKEPRLGTLGEYVANLTKVNASIKLDCEFYYIRHRNTKVGRGEEKAKGPSKREA